MKDAAAFELPAFAKINLCLHILGKREDGYHEIVSVMQTVSLADRLKIEPASDLTLECIGPEDLPSDDGNLVIRTARQIKRHFGVDKGARIRLDKRIPMGGGLGGGSSDAAAVIIGLCRLWNIEAEPEELSMLAARIGADVPFFLHGGTAIACGTGTDIIPVEDVECGPMLVVAPASKVSTAVAYSMLKAENLTFGSVNRILPVCRRFVESGNFPVSAMQNDFEGVIFSAFPEILRVRNALLEYGARHAVLSGSGSSVVGLFDNEETRQTAIKALDDYVSWRKFAVAAIGRDEFRARMGLD